MLLAIARVLARLPLSVVHALGAAAGLAVYLASSSYRRRLQENLRQAGYDPKQWARAAAAEAGKQALESPWVWLRPRDQLAAKLHWNDGGVLTAALAEGRPIIALTPHLGCFEACAQAYVLRDDTRERPMTVLYRRPRKAALAPLVEQARAREGMLLAPADMRGVRMLMRALKQRHAAGILPDQVPAAGEGVWAPFFGRPAYSMVLPGKLAASSQAIVVLFLAQRLPGGRGYEVSVERLAEPLVGEPLHDATVVNRAVERLVARCPAQYLWGYNRYKKPAHAVAPPEGVHATRDGGAQ